MKLPTTRRLLSAPWLIAALAAGCGGRPEGDLPAPRAASQKEMDDAAKSVEDGLRQVQANGLTTAKKPR